MIKDVFLQDWVGMREALEVPLPEPEETPIPQFSRAWEWFAVVSIGGLGGFWCMWAMGYFG